MHGGNVWQGGEPGDWLDFSANLRPEGPPDWVIEAMRGALSETAYYPDPEACKAREGLAGYLGVDPECVLPTAGGIAAIDLVNRLDAPFVTVTLPGFAEYGLTAAMQGKRVRKIVLDTVGIESPSETLLHQGDLGGLTWLCNPHNPLGRASRPEEIARLLERVEAAHGWLAVDEAFIEYCPGLSVHGWVNGHERLVVAGSLTKILGIPGVRLGYVCGAPKRIQSLEKMLIPWSLNCFAAAVAEKLPEHRTDIEAYANQNRVRREALQKELRRLGIFAYESNAPFILAQFDRPVAPIAARLKKHMILVRECMDFAGIDDGRHLRLAVKTEEANARLIQRLQEAMTCVENP